VRACVRAHVCHPITLITLTAMVKELNTAKPQIVYIIYFIIATCFVLIWSLSGQ